MQGQPIFGKYGTKFSTPQFCTSAVPSQTTETPASSTFLQVITNVSSLHHHYHRCLLFTISLNPYLLY